MSSEDCRDDVNIRVLTSTSKDCNYHCLENNSTVNDGEVLIWCDTSIDKNKRHDQYTLSQLCVVSEQVITFTDEEGCLKYIDQFQEKNKLLLIISGSLGEKFVPKIAYRVQIHSIYIFCGRKAKHEGWARKHEKIKGVYDKITELRRDLECQKENLEKNRMDKKMLDLVIKTFPWSLKFQEFSGIQNSKHHDDQQSKDDIKQSAASANVPFSKQLSCSTMKNVEMDNTIQYSETVTPHTHYKQQMEFADTGIWPCVSVINSTRNGLVTHLRSAIETMQYFNSTDNFLENFNNQSLDPHLIVLSNPENLEHVSQLIHRRVRRLYIYCSNNRLHEYDTWRERYPHVVSVLQHVDTLTRLILWDLSACIVDIANYYDNINKKDLAQTRYRYAYRLHQMIEGHLNNRIEMIEFNQSMKMND